MKCLECEIKERKENSNFCEKCSKLCHFCHNHNKIEGSVLCKDCNIKADRNRPGALGMKPLVITFVAFIVAISFLSYCVSISPK